MSLGEEGPGGVAGASTTGSHRQRPLSIANRQEELSRGKKDLRKQPGRRGAARPHGQDRGDPRGSGSRPSWSHTRRSEQREVSVNRSHVASVSKARETAGPEGSRPCWWQKV